MDFHLKFYPEHMHIMYTSNLNNNIHNTLSSSHMMTMYY